MFEAPDDVDLAAKVKELGKQLGRVKKQIEEALLLPHPAALASSSVQKNLADLLESAMDEEEDEKPSRGNRHAAKPPASDAKRRRRLSNRSAEASTDDTEDADEKTEPAAASEVASQAPTPRKKKAATFREMRAGQYLRAQGSPSVWRRPR